MRGWHCRRSPEGGHRGLPPIARPSPDSHRDMIACTAAFPRSLRRFHPRTPPTPGFALATTAPSPSSAPAEGRKPHRSGRSPATQGDPGEQGRLGACRIPRSRARRLGQRGSTDHNPPRGPVLAGGNPEKPRDANQVFAAYGSNLAGKNLGTLTRFKRPKPRDANQVFAACGSNLVA